MSRIKSRGSACLPLLPELGEISAPRSSRRDPEEQREAGAAYLMRDIKRLNDHLIAGAAYPGVEGERRPGKSGFRTDRPDPIATHFESPLRPEGDLARSFLFFAHKSLQTVPRQA